MDSRQFRGALCTALQVITEPDFERSNKLSVVSLFTVAVQECPSLPKSLLCVASLSFRLGGYPEQSRVGEGLEPTFL